MADQLQKYPIGESSFRAIRESGWLYVDKTADIFRLVNENTYLFLSRPRRFGKSLLVSTLHEYFNGNRNLFTGLAIDSLDPDPWPDHAVLHIDFNGQIYTEKDNLYAMIDEHLNQWESIYGKSDIEGTVIRRFMGVIDRAYKATGRGVVVLIDEYDKPIIDCMDRPELLEANRELLRSFYGAMKSTQGQLRFVFITGVGKMGNMNVFSGLNNIRDLTLSTRFSTICGITEPELHQYFHPGVTLFADNNGWSIEETYARLKKRYDGYHFASDLTDVYNPFSILNALADSRLKDYWYRTGTPTRLIATLRNLEIPLPEISHCECDGNTLEDSDVLKKNPLPLLYNTGYLTIKSYDNDLDLYTLGFPNDEVMQGFIYNLIPFVARLSEREASGYVINCIRAIRAGNLDKFFTTMRGFFAGFPYDLVAANESHYQDVLYCICKLLGFYVQAEYKTSQGRIDMLLGTETAIYIMEFKLDGTAEEALTQIDSRHYALPWADDGRRIVRVGVNFSRETRTIDRFIIA